MLGRGGGRLVASQYSSPTPSLPGFTTVYMEFICSIKLYTPCMRYDMYQLRHIKNRLQHILLWNKMQHTFIIIIYFL